MPLASMLFPKLYLTLQKELGQCSHMQNWDWCNNLSSFGFLLHCLHLSSPKGALTPCHNSSPTH